MVVSLYVGLATIGSFAYWYMAIRVPLLCSPLSS
jgi:hypothetical protein